MAAVVACGIGSTTEQDEQVAESVLHGPADERPVLGACLAEPAANVDDSGDGGGGEGDVLPVGGVEGDDGEVNVDGHPFVWRGGGWPRGTTVALGACDIPDFKNVKK